MCSTLLDLSDIVLLTMYLPDFVISLPLLVFGVIFIPNPITSNVKSWWMTYREKELAIERLATDERAPLGKLDLTIFKRVFGRWRFWIMVSFIQKFCTSFYLFISSNPHLEHSLFPLLFRIPSPNHIHHGSLAQSRKDIFRPSNQQSPHRLLRHFNRLHDRIRHLQRLHPNPASLPPPNRNL